MARPLSPLKRNAILAAAIREIATQGEGASTGSIARSAGVAEGSLFTYFSSKDELLNEVYLALKAELNDVMMSAWPERATLKSRARHVWNGFVDWGARHPDKRKVMAQLGLSERVSAASRTRGARDFSRVNELIGDSVAAGALRGLPAAFSGALLGAMAETTMDFMSRDRAHSDAYRTAGFEAFWRAISKR